MDVAALLLELYGRIPPLVRQAVDGLDPQHLAERPAPGANSIAWLVWHLTRVQDHHVAELLEVDQLWVGGGWAGRFRSRPGPAEPRLRPHRRAGGGRPTRRARPTGAVPGSGVGADRPMLEGLTAADLNRVVDRRWDPPVTLGVRLTSIADDGLQHVGQAAHVRGLLGV